MTPSHDLAMSWASGREETVRADADETILGAADAAGLTLPVGCRTGACGTCVGRLVDGRVAYDRPPRALKPDQVAAAYVLCCIARPVTDCRLAVGAAVHGELVTNPWE